MVRHIFAPKFPTPIPNPHPNSASSPSHPSSPLSCLLPTSVSASIAPLQWAPPTAATASTASPPPPLSSHLFWHSALPGQPPSHAAPSSLMPATWHCSSSSNRKGARRGGALRSLPCGLRRGGDGEGCALVWSLLPCEVCWWVSLDEGYVSLVPELVGAVTCSNVEESERIICIKSQSLGTIDFWSIKYGSMFQSQSFSTTDPKQWLFWEIFLEWFYLWIINKIMILGEMSLPMQLRFRCSSSLPWLYMNKMTLGNQFIKFLTRQKINLISYHPWLHNWTNLLN